MREAVAVATVLCVVLLLVLVVESVALVCVLAVAVVHTVGAGRSPRESDPRHALGTAACGERSPPGSHGSAQTPHVWFSTTTYGGRQVFTSPISAT